MNDFQLVCPCLFGLEGPLADELRKMGAQNVNPQNGRVIFDGTDEILVRSNICSRYAERVQVLMGVFPARSFEELFQGVKNLPWERWIGRNDAFPVGGSCLSSRLASVPDCQSIIKKAVVERLKAKYAVNWFEESGEPRRIHFLILKDTASIMIDTTGSGLHKRGYRANAAEAPIRETLAAAMVYFSRVRHDANFIDPFCGSGTILIEAALAALNIAPGVSRRFAAEDWGQVNATVWKRNGSVPVRSKRGMPGSARKVTTSTPPRSLLHQTTLQKRVSPDAFMSRSGALRISTKKGSTVASSATRPMGSACSTCAQQRRFTGRWAVPSVRATGGAIPLSPPTRRLKNVSAERPQNAENFITA